MPVHGSRRGAERGRVLRFLLPAAAAALCLRGAMLPGAAGADLPASEPVSAFPLPRTQVLTEESVSPQVLPELPSSPAAPVKAEDGGSRASCGTVYFKNQTDYTIDMPALLAQKSPVTLGDTGPQVLIMHTHGTEAYTPSPAHPYQASGDYRTTDPSANMLAVGDRIAQVLEEAGIETVHSTTLNDYPAYNGSYTRALKDIRAQLEENPGIRLVIDVHRDAIAANGVYYKTAARVEGTETAQLMLVCGTDQGGLSHPDWRLNLAFQAQLHDRINTDYPGIMRPMSIRRGRFNQHVRVGSLLVEVGSCGNTLEEALAAAEIFARELAGMLEN